MSNKDIFFIVKAVCYYDDNTAQARISSKMPAGKIKMNWAKGDFAHMCRWDEIK